MLFNEGSKLTVIGASAFAESGLESFVAPPLLREIGPGTFYKCENLATVILNEKVEIIGLSDWNTSRGVFESSGL